jgi:hypothetical protein
VQIDTTALAYGQAASPGLRYRALASVWLESEFEGGKCVARPTMGQRPGGGGGRAGGISR